MIDPSLLFGFLIAATLLTITPGVDTAMILRAAAAEGRRPAMRASIGIATGCLVWGAAASLGLSALLRASGLAYTVLQFAGAAYAMGLGAGLLFGRPEGPDRIEARPDAAAGNDTFRQSLLTNLLNPKVGVFYITFLPQFIPQGAPLAAYSFALACLHVALTLCWFALLIAATARLRRLLRRPRARSTLDRLTGIVLLGVGFSLATSHAR